MVFSANYALSRYGNFTYGLRNVATYTGTLSEASTAASNIAAVATCNVPLAEAASLDSTLTSLVSFVAVVSTSVATSDGFAALLIIPTPTQRIFAALNEKRTLPL